jgi:DNA processing protein
MTDATIVIESALTGGALITADIANSYHKEVFAFPGRVHDEYSAGCHQLIKDNKAHLVTSAHDIIMMMGWEKGNVDVDCKTITQPQLLIDLSDNEQKVIDVLKGKDKVNIDALCLLTSITQGAMAGILLQLEMKGAVLALPGKFYKLV